MSHLKHPIRSIREPFGKAGLTVAIFALVLAMVGGAYAAGGLTKSQEKQVKKIAKKYAGKPGAAGANGANGTNGTNGAKGDAGNNGASVTNTAEPKGANCEEGGSKLVGTSTTFACNGKKGTNGAPGAPGEPWTPNSQLPENATETGTWAFGLEPSGVENVVVPIPFTIQLAAPLDASHAHYVSLEEQENHTTPAPCSGTVAAPTAESGSLCVYEGQNFLEETATVTIRQPGPGEVAGAAPAGAVLFIHGVEQFTNASGTFAVTG